jgi:hypothetical protein
MEGGTGRSTGATSADTPSTPRMLKVLLPTTLPTAMSRWPRSAAVTDAATSGQRGAGGDDGQADHHFADAEVAREHDGRIDQQVRAEHQQTEPDDDQRDLRRQLRIPAGAFGAEARRIRPASPWSGGGSADEEGRVGDSKPNSSAPSPKDALPSSASANSSSDTPIMIGTSWRISCGVDQQRRDHRRQPRMNSTLKMLLPTTLAGHVGLAGPGRLHRHGEFRRTGAEGDDGQADDQRRNAEGQRKFRGAAHQETRSLLVAQRLDGSRAGGLLRRIEAEEDAH